MCTYPLHCVLWFIAWICFYVSTACAEPVHFGPLGFTIGMQAGVEYTDNINSSATNPKADIGFTFGPTVNGGLRLPIGAQEELVLYSSLGFTYKRYLKRGQDSTFSSPIAVALALPLHVGEWLVTVNDSFSFTNDPLESALAIEAKRPAQYNNMGSLTCTRRFGRFTLTLSGQRIDKWAPETPSTEETAYTFSVIPSVYLQENFSIFWANTVGFVFPTDYTSRSDGINLTSMVGVSGQITPVLSGSVGIGYVHSQFDPIGDKPGGGLDGVNANVGLNYAHPLRPNTTHGISFFYSPGVTATMNESNYQTTYGVTYNIAHRLNRQITLVPTVGWIHTQDESSMSGQKMDMIRVGLSLSRSFGRHLTTNLNYTYQTQMSNIPNQGYDVNRVAINFNYMF